MSGNLCGPCVRSVTIRAQSRQRLQTPRPQGRNHDLRAAAVQWLPIAARGVNGNVHTPLYRKILANARLANMVQSTVDRALKDFQAIRNHPDRICLYVNHKASNAATLCFLHIGLLSSVECRARQDSNLRPVGTLRNVHDCGRLRLKMLLRQQSRKSSETPSDIRADAVPTSGRPMRFPATYPNAP